MKNSLSTQDKERIEREAIETYPAIRDRLSKLAYVNGATSERLKVLDELLGLKKAKEYAEKVAYNTSIDNSVMIGKMQILEQQNKELREALKICHFNANKEFWQLYTTWDRR